MSNYLLEDSISFGRLNLSINISLHFLEISRFLAMLQGLDTLCSGFIDQDWGFGVEMDEAQK